MLKPPDYLVIDKSKQLYGIEVGGGKEAQSSNFASDTGSKMLTTENTKVRPRCPICGEWILFCQKVISDCCDIENNPLLRINKEREVRTTTKLTSSLISLKSDHQKYQKTTKI